MNWFKKLITGFVGAISLCSQISGAAVTTGTQQIFDSSTPEYYGAPADTLQVNCGTISATATQFTISVNKGCVAVMGPQDIGKEIAVAQLGAASGTYYGTITNITAFATTYTIGVSNAIGTTFSGVTTLAFGHSDTAGINAALAKAPSVNLRNRFYGIDGPINLPPLPNTDNKNMFSFIGHGATIVALAPTTDMLLAGTSTQFFQTRGTTLSDMKLDGMGLASYNIHSLRFGWNWDRMSMGEATIANIKCESLCENNKFTNIEITNGVSIPNTQLPSYCIDVSYSDNHFTDIICNQASVHDFWVESAATGNYMTNLHGYGSGGTDFQIDAAAGFYTNDYADGVPAGFVGFDLNSSSINLIGCRATVNSYVDQIGVQLESGVGADIVMGCILGSITTPAKAVVSLGSYSSIVCYNIGASYNNNCQQHGITNICESGVTQQSGSVTTEVNLADCLIPGGVSATNSSLIVTVTWANTSTAVAKTAVIRFGANGNATPGSAWSSGTQVSSASMTTNNASAQSLTIIGNNNSLSSQTTVNSMFSPYTGGAPIVSSSADTNGSTHVYIDCTDASSNGSTELCGISHYKVSVSVP